MKKTKKMLAAMLAVSTLAAALSGCSGGNKTDGSLEFTEAASADRIMGRQRQGRLNPARRRQIPMVKSLHQKAMGSCGRRPLRRSVL